MKSGIKQSICIAAIAAACVPATAQDTKTGYFLDEYTYRYQMNPAMGNDRGFVSMPALGNLNIGVSGTLHLSSVIYNVDGRTTTFLNPNLPAAEVMDKFKDKSRIGADLKINILSAGFKAFGGYNTISLNARAYVGVRVPKSIFSLAKEGLTNTTYDITDLGANANAYAELAFNHSRDITSEWRVGGTFKFLIGAANIDARFKKAHLELGENNWRILSDAVINASLKGLSYKTDINDDNGHRYVSGADFDSFSPGGFGIGFDLGAVYSPAALPDWQFSAALLDLGFIAWNNNMKASTNGPRVFETDKYTFNADDDAPNSFSKEWEHLRDDLTALYELDDMGDTGARATSLATTFNIGAQYTFPLYRPLTFGLLNTTRIQGDYSWTDFRLSANIAPCKVFSAAVSVDAGTFGCGFGWLLNLHTPGFNLFMGMDHTLGKVTKQFAPLNSNGSFNFGLDFLF